CTEAARHFNHGVGVDRDVDRGAALLERGCGLGYAPGCLELAEAYLRGQGVPRDEGRAIALLEGICALPEAETGGAGCFLLATLRHRGQSGAPVGDARAAFERACARGSFDGCAIEAHLL